MAISILSGDRRSGKSKALISAAMMSAMADTKRIVVAHPYLTNVRELKTYAADILKGMEVLRNVENTVINLNNGSTIYFYAGPGVRHIPFVNPREIYADEPNDELIKIIHYVEKNSPTPVYVMVTQLEPSGEQRSTTNN